MRGKDEKKSIIIDSVKATAKYFGRNYDDEVAGFYVKALIDYEIDDLREAFEYFRNNATKMPLISDFKARLQRRRPKPDFGHIGIEHLIRAGQTYEKNGFEALRQFAQKIGMSENDLNSVVNRFGPEKKKINFTP